MERDDTEQAPECRRVFFDDPSNVDQLTLFGSHEIADGVFDYEDASTKGEYTGERIIRDPARYQLIKEMLSGGASVMQTARVAKCDPRTVHAVAVREEKSIPTLKERTARRARGLASLCLEAMEDLLIDALKTDDPRRRVGLKELAVTFGILVDKDSDLQGTPNLRVRIEQSSSHEDYSSLLTELRNEYARQHGLEVGESGTKAALPAAAGSELDLPRPRAGEVLERPSQVLEGELVEEEDEPDPERQVETDT